MERSEGTVKIDTDALVCYSIIQWRPLDDLLLNGGYSL